MTIRLLACLLLLATDSWSQHIIYVSPAGSDNNTGNIQQPLHSIEAALGKIRTLPEKKVQIVLRQGEYVIRKTVTINTSTLAGKQLTINGFPGETVVISGAVPLSTKWQSWNERGWKTNIGKHRKIDQLQANGKPLPTARYPNLDSNARFFFGTSADALSRTRIRSWKQPKAGFVHALHNAEWGDFHYKITGKAANDSLLMDGGWQNNRPAPIHAEHRFVEHIFEELDASQEWYYDQETGWLYLLPSPEMDKTSTRFTCSALNELIVLSGSRGAPVSDVRIQNIRFTGTNRTFMETREPLLRSDWRIYRGGAIRLSNAERITIEDCELYALGGNAVFVSGYAREITVKSNRIHHIGASAIAFVGVPSAVRSPLFQYEANQPMQAIDTTPGPASNEYPANCTAENNLIHHIGITEKQVAGVQVSMAMDITVRHNTIYKVPRAGINIGDGCWGGHLLEYNDVFHTVLESGDHGAFNSWGRDRYWLPGIEAVDSLVVAKPDLPFLDAMKTIVIRNNRFHCEHGWDIDLDDGSSNYLIENNLCLNGGLKLREGFSRKVYRNTILNNTFHPHVWYLQSRDEFMFNTVSYAYAPIRVRSWGTRVDSNFFLQPGALAATQKNGIDLHSTQLDLGAFSLPESDMYGVQIPALKALAEKPPLPMLHLQTELKSGNSYSWQGATLKNIETLGEQSASGAPDKNGVLILEVQPGSIANRYGLVAGDIIKGVSGEVIKDIHQFVAVIQANNWKGELELSILHLQQSKRVLVRLK